MTWQQTQREIFPLKMSQNIFHTTQHNTTDSHYILLVLAPFAQYTRPESFYDRDNALESLEFNDKLHFHLPSHPNNYRQRNVFGR